MIPKNLKNQLLSPEKYIRQKARSLPVHECYIIDKWRDNDIAIILISRMQPSGKLTVGTYLVDLLCLGLKDTGYRFNILFPEFDELKKDIEKDYPLRLTDYVLVHNIIYGGIGFAKDYGFKPHKDFQVTQYILEEDEERIPFIDIEFGMEGKPCVLFSKDHPQKNVINQLEIRAGKGNYTLINMDEEEAYSSEGDHGDPPVSFPNQTLPMESDSYSIPIISKKLEDVKETDSEKSVKPIMRVEKFTNGNLDVELENISTTEMQSPSKMLLSKSYNITWDPIIPLNKYALVEPMMSRVEALYMLCRKNPKKAMKELEEAIVENPGVPSLYNYLATTYSKLNMKEKSDAAIMNCVSKFPDYFFGKINYAEILLMDGRHEEIPKLFDNTYELATLFPDRDTFHISEVIAFNYVMLKYFVAIGNIEQARIYLDFLEKLKKMGPGFDKNQLKALKAARYFFNRKKEEPEIEEVENIKHLHNGILSRSALRAKSLFKKFARFYNSSVST